MHGAFDLVVVGLGLIGAATVRHATAMGARVVGIGTDEPEDWTTHPGPFASHYDSGRITRLLDGSTVWAELAKRSIEEYPTIARDSGTEFHRAAGVLWAADRGGLDNLHSVGEIFGIDTQVRPFADQRVGAISLDPRADTIIERGPAGFIDARAMLKAQKQVARSDGATLMSEEVLDMRVGALTEVRTSEETVHAPAVVVAAGAYSGSLLPGVPAVPTTEAVVLGEVSPEVAAELDGMPCVIHQQDPDGHVDVYLIPPVRYPDGRWYLKLGAETAHDVPLHGPGEIGSWMASAADERREELIGLLTGMVPGVEFTRFVVKPCVYTRTPSGLPIVDHVNPRVVVATGGNGRAAKSADALGSLAARLALTGDWDDPLPSTVFELPV